MPNNNCQELMNGSYNETNHREVTIKNCHFRVSFLMLPDVLSTYFEFKCLAHPHILPLSFKLDYLQFNILSTNA